MKWDYMVERIRAEKIGPWLADRGREGWELCAVVTIYGEALELYFKRPTPTNRG